MLYNYQYGLLPTSVFLPPDAGYDRYMEVLLNLPTDELLKRYYELLDEKDRESERKRSNRKSWTGISHRIQEDLDEIAAELRKRYVVQTFDWVNNDGYRELVRSQYEAGEDGEVSVGTSRLLFEGSSVIVTVTVPRVQKVVITREVMGRILEGDFRDLRGMR